MKKSFPLAVAGHKAPRVIELIKRDVNKYVKRERRKPLPDGVDFWDFDCRVGVTGDSAESVHLAKVSNAIDAAAQQDGDAVYVEVLAKAGHRKKTESTSKDPAPPATPAASDWGDA